MELNGTSAIVTGGASGLGAATAQALAGRGVRVVIADLDRQQDKGESLAKQIDGLFVPTATSPRPNRSSSPSMRPGARAAAGAGHRRRHRLGGAAAIGKDGRYESAH